MMRLLAILLAISGYIADVMAADTGMFYFGDAITWLWWAGVAFSAALVCVLLCRTADSKLLAVVAVIGLFLVGVAAGVRALAFGYMLLCALRVYLGNERSKPAPLLVAGTALSTLLICFDLLAYPHFLRPASQIQGTLALAKSFFVAANWPVWQLTDWAQHSYFAIMYVGLISGFFWTLAALLLLRGLRTFRNKRGQTTN